jgi:hypothetical protein
MDMISLVSLVCYIHQLYPEDYSEHLIASTILETLADSETDDSTLFTSLLTYLRPEMALDDVIFRVCVCFYHF